MRNVIFIISLILVPGMAEAGRWLDYLRKYDLNDYAVGFAVTTRQNPYVGADNGTYAYPFLTSFRHHAFTEDWFVVRDGELGLRRITDSGWEFAVAGRMQTLGFGNHESEDLRGVSEPKWTIEMGPSIGLRRWPVHVRFATYFEPTDRHDGATGQLTLSYPIKWSRGYFVPAIEAIYQDDAYTEYYYSVASSEATPTRPSYEPGSATNIRARIAWGYELSDKWLLSGKLSVEQLADEIRSSPLVARDQIWSVNLGLAYNSDVFGVDNYAVAAPDEPRFNLSFGVFQDNIDSKVGRDAADGTPGLETDLENVLGESEQESLLQLDTVWHFGRYHRIEAGYFELVRNGSGTLDEDLVFGDTVFAAATDVKSRSHFKSLRLGYAYSLVRDTQKEFGVMAGMHFSSFDTTITSTIPGQTEKSKADAPLPVIGAHASVFIGEKSTVTAKLQMFRTDFDHYEGSLNYFTIDFQRRFGSSMNLGLGYNFYDLSLRSSHKDLNGFLKLKHHGPVLFLGYNF